MRFSKAFTLIELLIVVAIISILAAIAIPNMLEAQTRAKIARVKAEHRTISTALECYRVDNGNYPPSIVYATDAELYRLTTPISYLTSIPRDQFDAYDKIGQRFPENVYDFVRFQQVLEPMPILKVGGTVPTDPYSGYVLVSTGPDGRQEEFYIMFDVPGFLFTPNSYDPTNGTISKGDIYTFGSSMTGK
jgi:type II secretion system protein G